MYSFMAPIALRSSIVMMAKMIMRKPSSGFLWLARCSLASAVVMNAIATNCRKQASQINSQAGGSASRRWPFMAMPHTTELMAMLYYSPAPRHCLSLHLQSQ